MSALHRHRNWLGFTAVALLCLLCLWVALSGDRQAATHDRQEGLGRGKNVAEESGTSLDPPRRARQSADAIESRRRAADVAWTAYKRAQSCADLKSWQRSSNISHARAFIDFDPQALPSEAECEGVAEHANSVAAALRRAVDLGSEAAERAYAMNPRIGGSAYLNVEAWRDWRSRAPRFLAEAVGRGDGEAAMLHGVAAMQPACEGSMHMITQCLRSFPLNAVLPHDNVEAYAYLLLARQLGVSDPFNELGRLTTQTAERLTDAQRAEATARADSLRAGIAR